MKRINVDTNNLYRAYQAGACFREIGKQFDMSWATVRQRFIRAKLPLRSISESHRIAASHASQEERSRRAASAHNAVRDKRQTFEHRCKIALTREQRGLGISRIERQCLAFLEESGFNCIPQKAIGPYNVDIAITELPITVEIFGGHWHTTGRHARRFRKRIDYILNAGWYPIIVWVTRDYPLEIGAIKHIVSFAKKFSSSKTIRRQEQMIRGDGQPTSIGKCKFNNLPIIHGSQPRNKTTGHYTSSLR